MKNNKKTAVILRNVTKKYFLHHEKPTLTEKFINHKKETFTALDKINLTIGQGEKVGIIGPNGSGKTTLLKIISGITMPTKGSVKTRGRIVSLIDMEAGFHPDLTGEQNIYLNGMLIGMKKNEIKTKIQKIISYADIGNFIDIPLFTYSEGMKLKLGFSIAIHADPEILILDEGLWAGDLKFQKSSSAKLKSLFKMNKTVIVVSHWLPYIKANCDRIILIKKGKIILDDSIKIISKYVKDENSFQVH